MAAPGSPPRGASQHPQCSGPSTLTCSTHTLHTTEKLDSPNPQFHSDALWKLSWGCLCSGSRTPPGKGTQAGPAEHLADPRCRSVPTGAKAALATRRHNRMGGGHPAGHTCHPCTPPPSAHGNPACPSMPPAARLLLKPTLSTSARLPLPPGPREGLPHT